jgi:hypothetical protein
MKILSAKATILATVVCGLFMACETAVNTDLKGKWNYSEWTMAGSVVDIATMGNPVIDFQENDVFTVKYGDQSNTEKWNVQGDTLFFNYKDGKSQSYLMTHKGSDTLELNGKSGNIETRLVLVRLKE